LRLKLSGQVHTVVRKSAEAFEVDGFRVDASAVAGRKRVFVVREGDRVFAQIDGRAYNLTVMHRAGSMSGEDSTAHGGLEAPMPGRVTRVAVSVGERVKRGQELIVVEAMKMENALVAPWDGTVKSLAVKVGDMVAPGKALVVIEAAS
jgi:biotin carboxyl carrier protein